MQKPKQALSPVLRPHPRPHPNLGAALWVQDHFREEIESGEVHFSGSSGGAIVACVTALNLDLNPIMDEITTVVHQRARFKPWLLPIEVR